jgi:hypothetical protein
MRDFHFPKFHKLFGSTIVAGGPYCPPHPPHPRVALLEISQSKALGVLLSLLRFDARREGVTTQNWPAISNSNGYGISRWIAGLWAKSIKGFHRSTDPSIDEAKYKGKSLA